VTVEAQLQALLAPLAAGGCWPVVNTSATIVYPYIVFYEIVRVPEMLSSDDLCSRRIQVDVFAKSYGQAKALSESIRSAVAGSTLVSAYLSSMDGEYNPVAKDYQVINEFKVWAE
jgi:hypothetical protein